MDLLVPQSGQRGPEARPPAPHRPLPTPPLCVPATGPLLDGTGGSWGPWVSTQPRAASRQVTVNCSERRCDQSVALSRTKR